MTRKPRVLVVYKKSAYQLYVREHRSTRLVRLLREGHASVSRLRQADRDHAETLASARRVLASLGTRATFRYRGDARAVDGADLVVTLGGDGTLLWASHHVGPGVPMVAINTAPRDSVGFFCAGTKDVLDDVLAAALAGRLRATQLTRMRVEVDGTQVADRVLNDALFCHECPAATSRYLLSHGSRREEQRSSGLWIGPAAGSTAAQRSAGGRVLPASSRKLQFVVREPYTPDGVRYRLRQGLIGEHDRLAVTSKMQRARLYIDGPHHVRRLDVGAEIAFSRSDEPLTLLGLRRR